ncbi:hypothetical protein ACEPAI_9766 [Sanghuangporus weigelae]
MASSSRSSTPLSTSPRYLSSRIHDAVQVAPYLTHVIRHHGQVTLIPPENAGRIRKVKKKRPAAVRVENSSASLEMPRASTSRSRPNTPRPHSSSSVHHDRNDSRNGVHVVPSSYRAQDDLCIPDFPPPSFEEAMMATPSPRNSTLCSLVETQPSTGHHVPDAANRSVEQEHVLSPAAAAEQEVVPPSEEEQTPTSPGSSHSSLEESVDTGSRSLWEQDREAGYSLEERVQRELERRRLEDSLPRAPVMHIFKQAEELAMESAGKTSRQDSSEKNEADPTVGEGESTCQTLGISEAGNTSTPASRDNTHDDLREDLAPSTRFQSARNDEPSGADRFLRTSSKGKGKEKETVSGSSFNDISREPSPNWKPGESGFSRLREILNMPLRPQLTTPNTEPSENNIQPPITSDLYSTEPLLGPSTLQPTETEQSVTSSLHNSICTSTMTSTVSLASSPQHTPPIASISPLSTPPSTSSSPSRSSRPLPIPPPPAAPSSSEFPGRRPLPALSASVSVRERISVFEMLQSRPVPPPPPFRNTIRRPPPPVPGPSNIERARNTSHTPADDGDATPANGGIAWPQRNEANSLPRRRRTPPPVPPHRRRLGAAAPVQVNASSIPSLPPTFSTQPTESVACTPSALPFQGAPIESSRESPLNGAADAPGSCFTSDRLTVVEGNTNEDDVHLGASFSGAPLPPADALPHPVEMQPDEIPSVSDDNGIEEMRPQSVFTSEVFDSTGEGQDGAIDASRIPPSSDTPLDNTAIRSNEHFDDPQSTDNSTAISPDRVDDNNGPAQVRPLQPMFTGPTELDLLLARLDDPDFTYSGRSYDDLLLLEEIMGPAIETLNQQRVAFEDIPLGRIEVLRRRVTKDGRTKLKLALLGVVVDKCGICLVQFKGDAFACMLPCRHAFHENCLRLWMRRGQTCPLCRGTLCTS